MKVLIVHSRMLCYFSSEFFLERIANELEKQGVEVVSVYVDTDFALLEQLENEKFDAVLDINSKLPYLQDDNGDFWLDKLKAPFFNYILDHPLYHHPGLEFELNNYHAIGIDKHHVDYMSYHYPHLKSVSYLPVFGSKSINEVPNNEKRGKILFPGTYLSPKALEEEMMGLCDRFSGKYKTVVEDLIDMWECDTYTLELTLEKYLKDKKTEGYFWAESFRELLNTLYLVDRIKRNRIREKIIKNLAAEFPLSIMGEGWECFFSGRHKNVELIPSLPYANYIELMAKYSLVLDICPVFLMGIHDRASNAFANRTICISNMNRDIICDEDIFISFKGDRIGEAVEKIARFDTADLNDMAERAYSYYENNLSVEKLTEKFIEIIKEATD